MRAAIYARVSTRDGRQHLENQLVELRRYADAHGWRVVDTYTDEDSGSKGPGKRPGFAAMIEAASRRRFDVLLVWSLDRFSRQGTVPTLGLIHRLRENRVEFHSFTEEFLRTSGAFGDAFIGVMAAIANFERQRLRERVLAGMDGARRRGARIGRPTVRSEYNLAAIDALLAQGVPLRQICKVTKISRTTLYRIQKEKKTREQNTAA